MKYDLSTSTGRSTLAARISAILNRRNAELPYTHGTYHPEFSELFNQCVNIPPVDEIRVHHRDVMATATESYFVWAATGVANAYANQLGIEGISVKPQSEYENGVLVSPESFDQRLGSQHDWTLALRRIKRAVGERLGNGDYEATTMFAAMAGIHATIDNSRIMAAMWSSLALHLESSIAN